MIICTETERKKASNFKLFGTQSRGLGKQVAVGFILNGAETAKLQEGRLESYLTKRFSRTLLKSLDISPFELHALPAWSYSPTVLRAYSNCRSLYDTTQPSLSFFAFSGSNEGDSELVGTNMEVWPSRYRRGRQSQEKTRPTELRCWTSF